jgi:O-antigen/teichoic acid export membrane protein
MKAVAPRPSLLSNAVSNWASLGTTLLVGFILTPIIILHVGKDGYGIWTLVSSIIGYYGVLDLGIGSAVGRYVAFHAGKDDDRAINETVSTALLFFTLIGCVVLVGTLLCTAPLARFFNVEAADLRTFHVVLGILGVNIAVEFPGKVFRASLRAREYFVASNVIVVAVTILRAVLTIALLWMDYGLIGVSAAHLATNVLGIAAHAAWCRRVMPEVVIRPRFANRATAATLVGFGGATLVITVADMIRFGLDAAVIGRFMTMNDVGVYGIASLLIRYLMQGVTTAVGVVGPRFARLAGSADRSEMHALLDRSLLGSALLASGGALILIAGGRLLIRAWVGPEFLPAYAPLVILAGSSVLGLAQAPMISVLYALNRHRYYAVLAVGEAVANLALSLALVRTYGIVGVALGTAIPMLVVKTVLQPLYLARCLGISAWTCYRPITPAIIVSAVAGIAWAWWG